VKTDQEGWGEREIGRPSELGKGGAQEKEVEVGSPEADGEGETPDQARGNRVGEGHHLRNDERKNLRKRRGNSIGAGKNPDYSK